MLGEGRGRDPNVMQRCDEEDCLKRLCLVLQEITLDECDVGCAPRLQVREDQSSAVTAKPSEPSLAACSPRPQPTSRMRFLPVSACVRKRWVSMSGSSRGCIISPGKIGKTQDYHMSSRPLLSLLMTVFLLALPGSVGAQSAPAKAPPVPRLEGPLLRRRRERGTWASPSGAARAAQRHHGRAGGGGRAHDAHLRGGPARDGQGAGAHGRHRRAAPRPGRRWPSRSSRRRTPSTATAR